MPTRCIEKATDMSGAVSTKIRPGVPVFEPASEKKARAAADSDDSTTSLVRRNLRACFPEALLKWTPIGASTRPACA